MSSRHMITFEEEFWDQIRRAADKVGLLPTAWVRQQILLRLRESNGKVNISTPGPTKDRQATIPDVYPDEEPDASRALSVQGEREGAPF